MLQHRRSGLTKIGVCVWLSAACGVVIGMSQLVMNLTTLVHSLTDLVHAVDTLRHALI